MADEARNTELVDVRWHEHAVSRADRERAAGHRGSCAHRASSPRLGGKRSTSRFGTGVQGQGAFWPGAPGSTPRRARRPSERPAGQSTQVAPRAGRLARMLETGQDA